MKKLKILQVSPTQFMPVSSGVKEVVYQTYSELKRREHEVIAISYPDRPIVRSDGALKSTPSMKKIFNLLDLINWRVVRMNTSPIFLLNLIKIIREKQIDIVHVEGFWTAPVACLAAKITFRPCIIRDHNVPTFPTNEYTRPMQLLGKLFVYIGMKLSRAVAVTMEKEREFLIDSGYEGSKISVLPHGVDINKFEEEIDPSEIKFELGMQQFDPLVIFVGDFSWAPNVYAAKKIAEDIAPVVSKKISNAKFLVVGHNPPAQYSNPCVIYAGGKYGSTLVKYIKSSDIGIAPLDFGGGISIKVLEYMAAGIPVVSTTFGVRGIRVEHGKHALITDDYEIFSEYIIDLLENKEKRTEMGAAGKRLVEEQYSWKAAVDMLERKYEEVIS